MIEYESLKKVNETYSEDFSKFFKDFVSKGWYVLGSEVSEFEINFSDYIGSHYCVGVANGLDALILSLKALDLPKNAEVIVPSNTYIATILSVIQAGYKPILVEPDILTYNINPDLIESSITPNTKAILITHLYGKSCEMDPILEICEKYGLYLLEDCAQAHGAKYKGKMCGTFGILSSFSFYPTKNLGALGDAGAILTDDPNLAEKLKALRNYGSEKKYHNKYIGYNSRLDELQAGILNIKLKRLDEVNAKKNGLANSYFEYLNNKNIVLPVIEQSKFDVFHIFNIRTEKRNELKEYLFNNGVITEIHYPVPPHKQVGYNNIFNGAYPISELIHSTTLSLPISSYHTHDDVMKVCKLINSFNC